MMYPQHRIIIKFINRNTIKLNIFGLVITNFCFDTALQYSTRTCIYLSITSFTENIPSGRYVSVDFKEYNSDILYRIEKIKYF